MTIQSIQLEVDGTRLVIFTDGTGMSIPSNDTDHYGQMIQEWIDAGNTPTPYVEPELSYQDKRRLKYSKIGDQLDMQYKDLVNGTTVWKDHIAQVKLDIPKE